MAKRALEADVEIGHRIRVQRLANGMTQTKLADACGVTFQQIQKYEKGANRVGGSRMQRIADALGVAPALFFATSEAGQNSTLSSEVADLLINPGAIQLLRDYAKLPVRQRNALLQTTAAMVAENGNDP
jgi:transcriptional regulator with XRE-family HTH domain